ncbi:N-6 DNA methylase, partial [Azospirillum sp. TSO22-1]|uniref:N-6 DNA methylase n=1 Tax=Azospirillum sp. TSO22-1 TaxID=716789 RepID=UPI000D61E5DF
MVSSSISGQEGAFRSERQLAAVAAALAGAPSPKHDPDADPALVAHARAAILRGEDPLGEALMTLRSAEQRRPDGATYTPWEIVHAMTAWGAEHGAPERVVDIGAGSGRYLLAAADAFPDARLIGVERDPLAARLLRANLAVRGLGGRATVIVDDYRR